MMFNSGTDLGRYEIRSQLGARGMGEVYPAKDTKLKAKNSNEVMLEEDLFNRLP